MTDPKQQKPADSKPVKGTEEEFSSPPTFGAAEPVENHDGQDVQAALARKTHDGRGEDEVPESDFISFATPGVERVSAKEIAQEVLNGHLGSLENSRRLLQEAGYDPREVQIEINRRLAAGAPSAYAYSTKELAQQVIRGEWGKDTEMPRNLEAAGYDYAQVQLEVNRQLGK